MQVLQWRSLITTVQLPEASTYTIGQSFRTFFKLVPHHREEPLAVGSAQLVRTPSIHTYIVPDWHIVKMGGLEHYRMAMDPAIQKLGAMQSNRFRYFRWTPRTASITLAYVVVIPAIVGVIAYRTDGLWDLRAKRKGDSTREW
ncbi:NADH dehydrogenase (ubiquinone) 1 beta subcomplex subunit 4 [Microdochium nivale]|nr:NADH dehydrogenase (ubiquinone) 1 beta subcomplex subunit 4 [Microdochium nivale]